MYSRVILTKSVRDDIDLYLPVGEKTNFSELEVSIIRTVLS